MAAFSGKVFLMTVGDRYQPYEMYASDGKIYFSLFNQNKESSKIMHDLTNLHVNAIDSPD